MLGRKSNYIERSVDKNCFSMPMYELTSELHTDCYVCLTLILLPSLLESRLQVEPFLTLCNRVYIQLEKLRFLAKNVQPEPKAAYPFFKAANDLCDLATTKLHNYAEQSLGLPAIFQRRILCSPSFRFRQNREKDQAFRARARRH